MAIADYIRSVDLTNNTNNLKNETITGRTVVADFGNNYWTIRIETVPMSQKDWYDNFVPGPNLSTHLLFGGTAGDSRPSTTFKLPIFKDKLGTATGTITVSNDSSTSPGYSCNVGSNTIAVTGGTGTLLAGDIIKFSNHSKVYMITSDVDLDGSSKDTISITPRLIKNVSGATITYTDVPFTVIPDGDVEEWQVSGYSAANTQSTLVNSSNSTQSLFRYEQIFREVVL